MASREMRERVVSRVFQSEENNPSTPENSNIWRKEGGREGGGGRRGEGRGRERGEERGEGSE